MDCGMILNVTSVDSLTDKYLPSFLCNEAQESQTTIMQRDLTKLVKNILKMDMSVKSAKGRLKLLFVE